MLKKSQIASRDYDLAAQIASEYFADQVLEMYLEIDRRRVHSSKPYAVQLVVGMMVCCIS